MPPHTQIAPATITAWPSATATNGARPITASGVARARVVASVATTTSPHSAANHSATSISASSPAPSRCGIGRRRRRRRRRIGGGGAASIGRRDDGHRLRRCDRRWRCRRAQHEHDEQRDHDADADRDPGEDPAIGGALLGGDPRRGANALFEALELGRHRREPHRERAFARAVDGLRDDRADAGRLALDARADLRAEPHPVVEQRIGVAQHLRELRADVVECTGGFSHGSMLSACRRDARPR